MLESQLLSLTESIYDAATGTTPWAAVGRGLTRLFGAGGASLMVGDLATGRSELLYHGDIPMDAVAAYRSHYRSVDLWTNRAARAVAGRGPDDPPVVWTSGHLVPDAEFLRSEFYSDFGRPLGLRYVVGTVLPLGAAGAMPIGLHRPDGAAPFEAADARLLALLLPHLRRALQLRHQLRPIASASSAAHAALDALSGGVLVVDAELRVLLANAAAEAMSARGAGLRLVGSIGVPGGRSTRASAATHGDGAALASLVRATALGRSSGGAARLRAADGSVAAAALVSPVPRRLLDDPGGPIGRVPGQALILLRDLTAAPPLPDPGLLRTVFGLTPVEAEVARQLAGGTTKEAVASRRGSRPSTVRTQVRSILEKTGTANLRDLERLLVGLGPS